MSGGAPGWRRQITPEHDTNMTWSSLVICSQKSEKITSCDMFSTCRQGYTPVFKGLVNGDGTIIKLKKEKKLFSPGYIFVAV